MKKVAYRVEEVCILTGLGRTKVYAEIKAGRLRPIYFGKSIRIPTDELEAYIDRAKAEAGLAPFAPKRTAV
jgi:excisionase family DNA binding protein